MRTPIASENAVLAKNGVEWVPVGFRLQVKDHLGAWQVYDVEAVKGTVRNSVDQPALSFSGEIVYQGLDAANLSPLYSSPKPIDLLREFRLEAGYLASGGSVLKWHSLIEGRIDEIDLPDRYRMQLAGQSLMGHLNRLWVQRPDVIGNSTGRRSDLVVQDVLTEWGGGVSLYVPSVPPDSIKTTKIDPQPVAKAVRDIALRIGWDVIDKWDEATGQWRLTLWDPGRSNTASLYTFGPTKYLDISAFALKAARIRNALEVPYGSGSSRGIARVDRTNNADCLQSYNDYGVEIFVNFGEDALLKFENASQANAFLTAAASDLAQPPLVASWELGFFPFVELGDIYTFQANNVQHSADQKLAVVGYEHSFNGVGGRTTLHTRGKPAGGIYRWAPPAAPENPNGPGDASIPSPPANLSGSFSGPDANLKWDQPTETGLEVEVKVFSSSVLRRTERVLGNAYAYTLQKNRDDHGGSPSPALSFEVRFVRITESGAENLSSPASLSLSNPAPPAPTGLTLTGQPLYFLVSVNDPALSDYLRTEVEADDNASFTSPTLAHAGPDWRGIRVGLESTTGTTYVRARFVDVFGQASPWTSSNSNGVLVGGSHIAAQAIDVAKFASGIRPVQIVSSLPPLPDSNYPEGAVVFLTADDKLYRSTGSSWTASVAASDLAGMLGGANLLTNSSFDVDSNGDGVADGWAVYNNTGGSEPASAGLVATGGWQNGRYQRVSWSNPNTSTKGLHRPAAVPGGWAVGQWYVVSWYAKASGSNVGRAMDMLWNTTPQDQVAVLNPPLSSSWQRYAFRVRWTSGTPANEFFISIQFNSGTTGQLDLDAVQVEEGEALTAYAPKPGEILPGSITQTEIADGSVTTPKLVAGAVTAGVIAAGAVQAQHLAANSVVAGKIAAGAVSVNELAAKAVTIEKLAIGSFTNNALDPGFEDTTVDGWIFETGWLRTSGDKYKGTYSAAFNGSTGAVKNKYAFPVTYLDPVYAEAWVKCASADGNCYVRIDFFDGSGNEIGYAQSAYASTSTSDWQRLRAYGTGPAGTAKARVSVVVVGRTTGVWLADDVLIIPAQRGELIVDGSITANKLTALELNAITGTFGGGANKTGIDNKGVRVYDSTNTLAVAMGDIGGLQWGSGSLATGTYGLWGKLGAGVYLRGAPRRVAFFARLSVDHSIPAVNNGASLTYYPDILNNTFSPAYVKQGNGMRLYAKVTPLRYGHSVAGVVIERVEVYTQYGNSTSYWTDWADIPNGTTLDRVHVRAVIQVRNVSGANVGTTISNHRYDVEVFEIEE